MQEPARTSEKIWHVTAKDGRLGPLTPGEIAVLAASRRISPESLGWRPGMEVWQPCGLIPELAEVLASPAANPAEAQGKSAQFLKGLRTQIEAVNEERAPRSSFAWLAELRPVGRWLLVRARRLVERKEKR